MWITPPRSVDKHADWVWAAWGWHGDASGISRRARAPASSFGRSHPPRPTFDATTSRLRKPLKAKTFTWFSTAGAGVYLLLLFVYMKEKGKPKERAPARALVRKSKGVNGRFARDFLICPFGLDVYRRGIPGERLAAHAYTRQLPNGATGFHARAEYSGAVRCAPLLGTCTIVQIKIWQPVEPPPADLALEPLPAPMNAL